jgi:hypothetical protein
MNKPAAVIDKSLLQEICEQDLEKQSACYKALKEHYQVGVPSVLIEEIWVNLAKLNKNTSQTVLANMRDFVIRQRDLHIAEPLEIAFAELVKGETIKSLPRPANNLVDSFFMLRPDDPALVNWVNERIELTKNDTCQRVKNYAEILPTEKSALVMNGKDFFKRFIRPKFVDLLADPIRKRKMLEGELGLSFRANHPECSNEIDKAFEAYSSDTFVKYQKTLNCIIGAMFYFYAPLCKIVSPNDGNQPIKILGRGKGDQSNNLADLRYVQTALMCDRLLTRDRGMHNVMTLLQDSEFWDGKSVFIDPKKDLQVQITQGLV